MQNIKTKDVLIYASMPRIVPRIKDLFSSGFSCVAFWMAHIYFTVRLLPANHPYLSSSNIGRFGVRHVVAEAAHHLKFTRSNIDQIFVFFGLLTGVVMLLAQFLILIYVLLVSPAMAFSWFDTPDPASDIAYNLLDRVFGVPGVFCSTSTITNCTNFSSGVPFDSVGPATGATVLPLPFQSALHQLFRYYSIALLLIAVLIFLYFIIVVVFETAVSGTPFGQRFQNVWVPVRLVVALGLLVPAPVAGVGATLNSGQYIVLYAAKYGSSFATVGWNGFNAAVVGHAEFNNGPTRPMGKRYSLFAIPEVPSVATLVEAMSIVHACAYSYARLYAETPNDSTGADYPPANASYVLPASETDMKVVPFLVKQVSGGMSAGTVAGNASLIGNPDPRLQVTYGGGGATPDYLGALGFYYGSDIIIRFGEYKTGDATFNDHPGLVKPICGDIRISVSSLADLGGAAANRGGADHMLKGYYDMVMTMWFDDVEMRQFARSHIVASMETKESVISEFCSGSETPGTGTLSGQPGSGTNSGFASSVANCESNPAPSAYWKQRKIVRYTDILRAMIRRAWGNHVNNSTTEDAVAADTAYGWIGAGVFYSKMAETNGGWIDSVAAVPYMDLYPMAMEQVRAQNMKSNENVEFKRQFTMSTKSPSGHEAPDGFSSMSERNQIALGLSSVFSYWNGEVKDFDEVNRIDYQNIFMDTLNLLFGTSGLMAMRTANAHLHPMVQLVAVGKGLVNSAIKNVAVSTGSAFLGGGLSALSMKGGKIVEAASQVLLSTAFMGLTAGFVLFYILPFLPFVYFYFAAASWIKAIFEAMVGVPLWALSHLRIDGDGLPGDSAQNGYFLILEIFIRPILTVVGLIAAIVIFSTQVQVLNLIWDLVTANVAGDASSTSQDILGMTSVNDRRFQRGIVDQFFFTIIYTMVCYMMALASFKLIDRIPDNILRWAGAGVSSFGDINQDQVDSLSRYAAMGGMTMGNQASGAIVKLGGGLGNVVGGQAAKSVEGAKVTGNNIQSGV